MRYLSNFDIKACFLLIFSSIELIHWIQRPPNIECAKFWALLFPIHLCKMELTNSLFLTSSCECGEDKGNDYRTEGLGKKVGKILNQLMSDNKFNHAKT